MSARVVAIDPSLTSTGCAEFGVDEHGVDFRRTWTVTSTGRKHASHAQQSARLTRITTRVTAEVLGEIGGDGRPLDPPHLVLFEGHANGMPGDPFWRYGLWRDLWRALEPWTALGVIEPKTIKKFATGKGSATKLQVVSAMSRRWPLDMIETDDEWDAMAAAEAAAHRVGITVPQTLTKVQREALTAVAWPDGLRAVVLPW